MGFPAPTPDGHLVTRAKGIYKSADLQYALSIGVMQSSPYADKAVERNSDGSWSLQYYQEGADPDPVAMIGKFTNRGLVACRDDGVPVGVLVQTAVKPVEYLVVGLGLVTDWAAGFFAIVSARAPGP